MSIWAILYTFIELIILHLENYGQKYFKMVRVIYSMSIIIFVSTFVQDWRCAEEEFCLMYGQRDFEATEQPRQSYDGE
jgi:uncharacterized protein